MNCSEWMKEQYSKYQNNKDIDWEVMKFIGDFRFDKGEDAVATIRELFRAGYCYYFASMIQIAFERGRICMAAPFNHFVWVDDTGVPYDIDGICDIEYLFLVDESECGDIRTAVLHVDKRSRNNVNLAKRAIMLKHGYIKNADKEWVPAKPAEEFSSAEEYVKHLCHGYYATIPLYLPSCWKEMDLEDLLPGVIQAFELQDEYLNKLEEQVNTTLEDDVYHMKGVS